MLLPVSLTPAQAPYVGERQQALDEALVWADRLAKASGDPEAQQVAHFLHAQAIVGFPLPKNRIGYVPRQGEGRLDQAVCLIVPVLSGDAWYLPNGHTARYFAKTTQSSNYSGVYYRYNRSILFSAEWQVNPLWIGLLLLHEGLHAYDHLVRRRHAPKPAWRRELNAHRLEYRVMCAFIGKPLQSLLNQLAEGLSLDANVAVLRRDASVCLTTAGGQLDSLFGEPISRSDRARRDSQVNSLLLVHLLEQKPKISSTLLESFGRHWIAESL